MIHDVVLIDPCEVPSSLEELYLLLRLLRGMARARYLLENFQCAGTIKEEMSDIEELEEAIYEEMGGVRGLD